VLDSVTTLATTHRYGKDAVAFTLCPVAAAAAAGAVDNSSSTVSSSNHHRHHCANSTIELVEQQQQAKKDSTRSSSDGAPSLTLSLLATTYCHNGWLLLRHLFENKIDK